MPIESLEEFLEEHEKSLPIESELTLLEAKNEWEYIKLDNSRATVEKRVVVGNRSRMTILGVGENRPEPLRKAVVSGSKFLNGLGYTHWHMRLYNVYSMLIEKSEFQGAGQYATPLSPREGHDVYANVLGSMMIRGNLFANGHGQGVQLVNRARETTIPIEDQPVLAEHVIRLENNIFLDKAQGAERGSMPLSVKNPGQRVIAHNTLIEYTDDFPAFVEGGVTYKSRGGAAFGDAQSGRRCPELRINRLRVVANAPSKPLLRLEGQDDVYADELEFEDLSGGVVKISVHKNCKNVVLSRIKGNVDVIEDQGGWRGPTVARIRGIGEYVKGGSS